MQYQVEKSDNVVSFADAFPFLIISEESLKDLNSRFVIIMAHKKNAIKETWNEAIST